VLAIDDNVLAHFSVTYEPERLMTRRSHEVQLHTNLNDVGRGAKFDDDKAAAQQCLIGGSRLRFMMI
jgi:hypothetical protein